MKERPILFSTPMVQAILAGRKTMTRRVVKTAGIDYVAQRIVYSDGNWQGESGRIIKCPYGKVGDLLWVRETWAKNEQDGLFDYKADYPSEEHFYGWKPSIHMPKSACRLFLRITNVRVERLQDITYEDAIAEGIKYIGEGDWYENYGQTGYVYLKPIESFCSLWQSINGEQSWNDNPYVWVIEFEQISKP